MYRIIVKETEADIKGMENRVNELMKRGIRIGDLSSLLIHYRNLGEQIKNEIIDKYNISNPNSSKQVIEYLKDLAAQVELGVENDIIKICMDEDTEKWTSNGDAMEKLADLGYEIGSDILEYRKYKKYGDAVNELLSAADSNRLIHPSVTLTKTNRISYVKPGIMNIPKELLWNMIVPYHNNDVLFSVDIKNQEPSILINYLEDDDLAQVLKSDKGLYEELFERVFSPVVEMNFVRDFLPENRVYSIPELRNVPFVDPVKYLPKKAGCESMYYNNEKVVAFETICCGYSTGEIKLPETVLIQTDANELYKVPVVWRTENAKISKDKDFKLIGDVKGIEFRLTKAERKEFKTAWNALSYGASSFGISKMCKIIDGKKVYEYFNNLASYRKYKKVIDNIIKSNRTGVPTLFGNFVYAGADKEDNKALKRALLDLPIQGTGADILSCLIKHFDEEVELRGLKDKLFIYYTRHDELIIEANGDWVKQVGDDEVKTILRDILEHQIIYGHREWEPFKLEVDRVLAEEVK